MSDAEQFKACLEKAGNVVTCSWTMGTVQEKEGGKTIPIVIFFDSSGMEFAHAFSFNGSADLLNFCDSLRRVGITADGKNRNFGLIKP